MSGWMVAWKRRGSVAGLALGLAVGLCGCRQSAPATPLDQLTPQQARGHVVFESRCAACHYDRVDSPLHGPAMAGLYKKPSLPSGAPANDERVTAVIEHGRNMMPAVAVDPQDLNDLLAYLHTI